MTVLEPTAPARPPAAGARDVIFVFSYITWEGARRRGMAATEDRMAQTLLAHPRVDRLLVCDPFRSLPLKAARDLLGGGGGFPAGARRRLLQPVRLRRSDARGLPALERTYRRYERRMRAAARAMGMERPAVIVAHPLLAGFGRFDWAGPVTFYAIDDWTAYGAHRRWWPAYHAARERLRESGRRVCAVSQTVLDRIAPTGPGLVVPNGLEPDEWERPAAAPDWFARLAGPRLLYVGSLDNRVDVGLLDALARAMPAASIVLVGPLLDPRHLAPLERRPNVVLHSEVGRGELTALVSAADACLIPHVRNPLTEGMSPLKLYEYLAAGRPVASVALAPVLDVDGRVVVAHDGDFVAAVQRALELGPAAEPERRGFVAANSWASRHEDVLRLALA